MDRLMDFVLNHPLNVFVFLLLIMLFVLNERRMMGKAWTPTQLVSLMNQADSLIIDLRPEPDFKHGHIINSINHPFSKLSSLAETIKKYKDKQVILVCANGRQSTNAQLQMKKEGCETARLGGGLIEWSVANLPLSKD